MRQSLGGRISRRGLEVAHKRMPEEALTLVKYEVKRGGRGVTYRYRLDG